MVKYSILQMRACDENRDYLFASKDFLLGFEETSFPPPEEIYECVHTASQPKFDPQELSWIFNTCHPKDYRGRSLSTSDIIQFKFTNGMTLNLFCDSFGYVAIDFSQEKKVAKEAEYILDAKTGEETITLFYSQNGKIDSLTVKISQIVSGKVYGTENNGGERPLTAAELFNVLYECALGRARDKKRRDASKLKIGQTIQPCVPMYDVNEKFMELLKFTRGDADD